MRDGDTVVLHSMDHLACNLDDLRALVRTPTGREVRVQFVTEQRESIALARQRGAYQGRARALSGKQVVRAAVAGGAARRRRWSSG